MRVRRWVVRAYDRERRLIGEDRFFLRYNADKHAEFQRKTATGDHHFLSPIPKDILEKYGPLFTVEVTYERG